MGWQLRPNLLNLNLEGAVRLDRLIKLLLALFVFFIFSALVCGGLLFVVSGGQPIDFLQTTYLRTRLAGREADLSRPMGTDETPIRFIIASGDTPPVIAANLIDEGLINDAGLFVDYVRVNDLDVELEAGTYFLSKTQTLPQIAQSLTDSRSSQFPFRILEGWRMEEVAAIIDTNPYFNFTGQDFIAVVRAGAPQDPEFAAYAGLPAGASLEGFLFPDTYQLPASVTPIMLRDILTDRFQEQVGTSLALEASQEGLTMFEAVTLASIVQREGVHIDEFERIASVYRNRVAVGMKLEADPTVQYGIGFEDGRWWPQITQGDYYEAESPYNTYINAGLPPGPIASPGIAAIRAAIHPEETPYIYFRAECDGSGYHNFAETFAEHVENGC